MPTLIPEGSDLAAALANPGEYELGPGFHPLAGTVTTAANVTLTAHAAARLSLANGAVLRYDDAFILRGVSCELGSGAILQPLAISGNARVDGATLEGNRFTSLAASPGYVRVGQGFNDYHRNIRIAGNLFDRSFVLIETGDAISILANRFINLEASLRAITLWGSNCRALYNWVDDCAGLGITLLGREDTAANRRLCTGNVIASNLVTGTADEGISIDVVGDIGAACTIREYDTVASKPGGNVINLSSGAWAAQTTYTGSRYHAVFISGALAGRYFLVTTHNGASFTLSGISGGEYSSITAGDGVSIQLLAYGNTIANNTIVPKLAAGDAYTTGIVLHGMGIDNDIFNNICAGYGSDPGGFITKFGIREYLLNGITPASSITGNARRGMVCSNRIRHNIVIAGGLGAEYRDYGSNPTYLPAPPSTYSGNSELADPGFVGGVLPAPGAAPDAYRLRAGSAAIRTGAALATYAASFRDYGGRRPRMPPDIGAWQRRAWDR